MEPAPGGPGASLDHGSPGGAGAGALGRQAPQVIGGRAPAAALSIHGVAPWLLPARPPGYPRCSG